MMTLLGTATSGRGGKKRGDYRGELMEVVDLDLLAASPRNVDK